jgi:hypothetical protein
MADTVSTQNARAAYSKHTSIAGQMTGHFTEVLTHKKFLDLASGHVVQERWFF